MLKGKEEEDGKKKVLKMKLRIEIQEKVNEM